jgi:hypothetical protein
VEGLVVETADLYVTRNGRLTRADGYPPHPERFARLGLDLPVLLAAHDGASPSPQRQAASSGHPRLPEA